jgi:hypothetical protein
MSCISLPCHRKSSSNCALIINLVLDKLSAAVHLRQYVKYAAKLSVSLPMHKLTKLIVVICSIRGNGEVIPRTEFQQRKAAAEAARQARLNRKPKRLASQGKPVEGYPLLMVSEVQEEQQWNVVLVFCLPAGKSCCTCTCHSPTCYSRSFEHDYNVNDAPLIQQHHTSVLFFAQWVRCMLELGNSSNIRSNCACNCKKGSAHGLVLH